MVARDIAPQIKPLKVSTWVGGQLAARLLCSVTTEKFVSSPNLLMPATTGNTKMAGGAVFRGLFGGKF